MKSEIENRRGRSKTEDRKSKTEARTRREREDEMDKQDKEKNQSGEKSDGTSELRERNRNTLRSEKNRIQSVLHGSCFNKLLLCDRGTQLSANHKCK